MAKLNFATAGIQTADPWVMGSKPNALTSKFKTYRVYLYTNNENRKVTGREKKEEVKEK